MAPATCKTGSNSFSHMKSWASHAIESWISQHNNQSTNIYINRCPLPKTTHSLLLSHFRKRSNQTPNHKYSTPKQPTTCLTRTPPLFSRTSTLPLAPLSLLLAHSSAATPTRYAWLSPVLDEMILTQDRTLARTRRPKPTSRTTPRTQEPTLVATASPHQVSLRTTPTVAPARGTRPWALAKRPLAISSATSL